MANKIVLAVIGLVLAYSSREYFGFRDLPKAPVVVQTSNGKLQGVIMKSRDDREFYGYLGVPFAQPPVGPLRFESPEPLGKWDGIRDASKFGASCLQVELMMNKIEGDEDCLFLNVFTPKVQGSKLSKLPVLVFIHGGLFSFGSSTGYRPDYFMDEDVILVTVNYRLGSFGFLNTGDGLIRGNMGLKDQQMSLKWVKDNIQHFGGDPDAVTIFGESAGGASVHYHLLSPMSKGLFRNAISQSGLATNPWALWKTPAEQAKRFAKKFQCNSENPKEMVKCLKSLPATDIVEVHKEWSIPLRPLISVFVPTLEKDLKDGKTFISENPVELISSGRFNKVPFMIGVNSAEGLLVSPTIVVNDTMMDLLNSNWETTLPPLLFFPDNNKPEAMRKIHQEYLKGEKFDLSNPMQHFQALTDMFSDWVWNLGAHEGIKLHSKQSTPVFAYYYQYDGEFSLSDIFMALKGDFPPIINILKMRITKWFQKNILGEDPKRIGSCHGDELAMEFSVPMLAHVAKDTKDYDFSRKMVKLWVTFATEGYKSGKGLEFLGQQWPAQDSNKELTYMRLNEKPAMISEPFKDRIKFWQSLKL